MAALLDTKPILAITMGDPAGIGSEVIAQALADPTVYEECRPIVIGDAKTLRTAAQLTHSMLQIDTVSAPSEITISPSSVPVIELPHISLDGISLGMLSTTAGRAAVAWIRYAAQLAQDRRVHGLVTAPVNKEAITRAGIPFTGHTEFLAALSQSRVAMLLATERLRVVHVSTHLSLRQACDCVQRTRILETIHIADQGCQQLGIFLPRIAVAGLNPHAGEHGLFGEEDIQEIAPAIADAQAAGINSTGPCSPDTVFYEATNGRYDCVVAMYHDQGHIAIKLTDFYGGVNITLGLPYVRTSVDHGTGFAIAGKGIANARSMRQAIHFAAQMAKRRMVSS